MSALDKLAVISFINQLYVNVIKIMTNASKISSVSVLIFAAAVLAFGAFATVANAQENTGYFETGGGDIYDEYFTPYANDTYDEYFTPYGSDTYDEYFTPYGSDTYDEYFTPYGSDTYDEYFSPYGNDIYDEYFTPYGNDVYDEYFSPYDDYDYVYDEGVAYSERSYSSPSYSQPSYSQPYSFRAPSTSYSPSYPQPRPQPQPVYQQPRQQQQQQQQQQGGGQPINIVNTNNNNNVNNNVNTAPVTPVYQAPVTYPVQYVYPQPVYPTYPTYPTYPAQNTYCVITASPSSITNGQASYLTWSSTGATSAWLSDGIGQVAVNGSLAVRPNSSKMYTLTVSGYGGTNTCTAYVTVQGSYVSLSQIPYTGFDAGLLGNALYWLSLISFAVAGAYLVVYYLPRNVFGGAGTASTFAFAHSTGSGQAGSTLRARKQNVAMHETVQIPEESKVEVVETPVETMTPSPIDVMEFLPVASVAHSTKDAMQVLPSNDGGAPRIVITRN